MNFDCPNVISVASTDDLDDLSWFSNFGSSIVHIAAPGSGILSTWPIDLPEDPYYAISGTSMAAPHVAGVAALVKSIRPEYTPEQLREVLIATARQTNSLDGMGLGILDAHAAVQ